MIAIYHNPRWGKSRKSVKILNENKYEYKIIEYLKSPISIQDLMNLGAKLNLRPKDFIRRSEKIFKELELIQHIENDDYLYDAMSEYPILIERPIVISKNKAIIARPPEKILEFIS